MRAATDVGGSGDGERDSQARKRAKMTLRIPDDEVARPADEVTIPLVQKSNSMSSPPPQLNADDTLELPSDELRARSAAALGEVIQPQAQPAAVPAAGVDPSHEPGWTPQQPAVDGGSVIQPTPIVEVKGSMSAPPPREPAGFPSSEEIPVAVDLGLVNDSDDLETSPRLPPTSEEVQIHDRVSVLETGEVEINPDDLMSVDSLPIPPPVKTAGKYPAYRSEVPVQGQPAPVGHAPHHGGHGAPQTPQTATAMMANAPPPAAPSQPPPAPLTPPVIAAAPVVLAPPPALVPPPAPSAPAPSGPSPATEAASPQMAARRQSTPVALAPPPMTDNAANRKKTRPWWEELFNDDFIRTMAKITDAQIGAEATFVEESLGCEAGAMVLDLACGTGRHAVELASRGYQVVGFDLSLAMLARASDEAQDRKQKINFVQGDMREMTFEETFDGVYSWNTSFGYFDESQNSAVIGKVHKALKKGGQFLLDVVNRDYIVRQAPSLAWFEGDGCICMDEMQIDFITSRMKVKRTLMMDDGRTKEIEYSIRVYSLHELGKMLHDNGFRVAEVSGRTGTPGVFFGCEAPRTLILAEKR